MICPCGSTKDYSNCCEPYITGKANPPTAEALMRSRYTAYVKVVPAYLKSSLLPSARADFDEKNVLEWAENSEWLGLEILSAKNDKVEFVARYKMQGKTFLHHEHSTFQMQDGKWYFVDGESNVKEEGAEPKTPVTRESPKVGRNDPCSCGSGKKFKKCCGN